MATALTRRCIFLRNVRAVCGLSVSYKEIKQKSPSSIQIRRRTCYSPCYHFYSHSLTGNASSGTVLKKSVPCRCNRRTCRSLTGICLFSLRKRRWNQYIHHIFMPVRCAAQKPCSTGYRPVPLSRGVPWTHPLCAVCCPPPGTFSGELLSHVLSLSSLCLFHIFAHSAAENTLFTQL